LFRLTIPHFDRGVTNAGLGCRRYEFIIDTSFVVARIDETGVDSELSRHPGGFTSRLLPKSAKDVTSRTEVTCRDFFSRRGSAGTLRTRRVKRVRQSCLCESLEVRALLSAAISGVVFNDPNGDGVQSAGESGFSGVSVTVTDSSNTTIATASTDTSGAYSITGLPTGNGLTVAVSILGYALEGSSDGTQYIYPSDGDSLTLPFAEQRTLSAPTDLTAVSPSPAPVGGETDLAWTSNSGSTETGFHVYESVNGGAFGTTPVATTGSNVTNATLTGFSTSNDYAFMVAAYDANGDSYLSNSADPQGIITGTVFNDANANGTQDPGEVGFSGLTLTAADSFGTTLGTATTDSSGHYTIPQLPINSDIYVSAPNTGWTTLYSDGNGNSGPSQIVNLAGGVSTLPFAEYRILPGPSSLVASTPTSGTVDLSWTSNSLSTETGFHVYESVNGGAFGATPVTSTTTNVTSATITGLSSANDYVFAVAAYDASGDSYWSGTADAAAPPAPTAVNSAALLDGSGNASATINWTAGEGSPSGTVYSIYRSTDGTIPSVAYATGISTTQYTDSSVTAGATYYYFISAHAASALAGGSTPASSMTPGLETTIPTQTKTISYFQSLYSGAELSGAYSTYYSPLTKAQVPLFDTSLGTLTDTSLRMVYTDSALFFDPNPDQAGDYGQFGAALVSTDSQGDDLGGTTLDFATLNYNPAKAIFHYQAGNTTCGGSWIGLKTMVLTSDAGDPDVMQGGIEGLLITTYTYT
jgi:hypothetical protein